MVKVIWQQSIYEIVSGFQSVQEKLEDKWILLSKDALNGLNMTVKLQNIEI